MDRIRVSLWGSEGPVLDSLTWPVIHGLLGRKLYKLKESCKYVYVVVLHVWWKFMRNGLGLLDIV